MTALVCVLVMQGCSEHRRDGRLDAVAAIVSESPREAMALLDSIDVDALSTADRHYYDFLSIKANDKAYVVHETDSLILDVIDYYSDHKQDDVYPEALYYGGRVYSDLGDKPTALRYFQSALDAIPETDEFRRLKCKTSSQTGRLLNSLRLYDEAVPYVQEAIRLDSVLNDTLNEVYDLKLLGHIFKGDEDYARAECCFRKAVKKSVNLPLRHKADSEMFLAEVERKKGNLDSALHLIRKTKGLVSPMANNEWLSYAVYTYWDAGILDSACLFARELISNSDNLNKKIGYHAVLSPELRHFISMDSLDLYISEYRTILETDFNENEAQLTINQQTSYNYELHERKKIEAERRNHILRELILGFVIVVILMAVLILYLKNRNKTNIINLQQALESIGKLRRELNDARSVYKGNKDSEFRSDESVCLLPMRPKGENLRERLKDELMSLYEYSAKMPSVSEKIIQSEIYAKLQKMVSESRMIKDDDGVWQELEKVVTDDSPKFVLNLNLLTSGRLTNLDLHTALLIKCGFKPSQMMILLGKSNGAIISRRETLCVKILGEKMGVKVIDGVIRLL